ncbi:MAG: hypothetical protein V1698_01490 [bacterium]
MDENNNLWSIVSVVAITALIVGGAVYYSQRSKMDNLQKDIDGLKNQAQNTQNQTQDNSEMQNIISGLQNQITDLQNQLAEKDQNETENQTPELTEKDVLSLLKNDLPSYLKNPAAEEWCHPYGIGEVYGTCSVTIEKSFTHNDQWNATVTYDRLADDSTRALKFTAIITYSNNQWKKVSVTKNQWCQPNRGHQDFSTAPCL